MRLAIYSDLHLDFSSWTPPSALRLDAVILAGDIFQAEKGICWASETFQVPVIYVAGNHEFYASRYEDSIPVVKERMRQASQKTDVHFLDGDQLVIGGVRFIGMTLWTDFRLYGDAYASIAVGEARNMSDFSRVFYDDDRCLTPVDTIAFHMNERARLEYLLSVPFSGKTIVVTHHAPSIQSIGGRHNDAGLNPSFASDLSDIISNHAIDMWVHGHTHHAVDYTLAGTRIVSNPRGYVYSEEQTEMTGFKAVFVIDI